jgi:hypothetical protein
VAYRRRRLSGSAWIGGVDPERGPRRRLERYGGGTIQISPSCAMKEGVQMKRLFLSSAVVLTATLLTAPAGASTTSRPPKTCVQALDVAEEIISNDLDYETVVQDLVDNVLEDLPVEDFDALVEEMTTLNDEWDELVDEHRRFDRRCRNA